MHKKFWKIYLHMVFTTKKKCAIMLVILNGAVGIFALTARKKRREIYDQRGNMGGYKPFSDIFV